MCDSASSPPAAYFLVPRSVSPRYRMTSSGRCTVTHTCCQAASAIPGTCRPKVQSPKLPQDDGVDTSVETRWMIMMMMMTSDLTF